MESPTIQCADCPCTMVRRPQNIGVQFVGGGWASKDG